MCVYVCVGTKDGKRDEVMSIKVLYPLVTGHNTLLQFHSHSSVSTLNTEPFSLDIYSVE